MGKNPLHKSNIFFKELGTEHLPQQSHNLYIYLFTT